MRFPALKVNPVLEPEHPDELSEAERLGLDRRARFMGAAIRKRQTGRTACRTIGYSWQHVRNGFDNPSLLSLEARARVAAYVGDSDFWTRAAEPPRAALVVELVTREVEQGDGE